jgi:hypothetical protein
MDKPLAKIHGGIFDGIVEKADALQPHEALQKSIDFIAQEIKKMFPPLDPERIKLEDNLIAMIEALDKAYNEYMDKHYPLESEWLHYRLTEGRRSLFTAKNIILGLRLGVNYEFDGRANDI